MWRADQAVVVRQGPGTDHNHLLGTGLYRPAPACTGPRRRPGQRLVAAFSRARIAFSLTGSFPLARSCR